MILKLGLRSVLCAVAIAIVMLNLFTMTPALASSPSCQPVHTENSADHHHGAATPPGCCDTMHCCPMLPSLPSPGVPSAISHRHHPHLKVEEPLLLVTSIDPPPRSPAS